MQHLDHVEEREKVVGKAGAGDKVGDEVDGKDEIAQHTYDEAFVTEGDGGIGEHVVEQQNIVNHFATRLGCGRLDFDPKRVVVVVAAILLYLLRY